MKHNDIFSLIKNNIVVVISVIIALALIILGVAEWILKLIISVSILAAAVGIGLYIQDKIKQRNNKDEDVF